MLRISAARCARVSYLTHDKKVDLEADLKLYDRLVRPDDTIPMEVNTPHASPLEHVAWATQGSSLKNCFGPGWITLRNLLPRENVPGSIIPEKLMRFNFRTQQLEMIDRNRVHG
jgi:hypothetical protein